MHAVKHLPLSYYSENDTRYVFLDGVACNTLSDCYDILQQQLSLPGYFGRNLDALDEVLSDLDWIPEKTIKIIIANSNQLLDSEANKRKDFLDTINSTDNDRVEIIYLEPGNTISK
jgi:RNAse (barnase) inhibitor barstar